MTQKNTFVVIALIGLVMLFLVGSGCNNVKYSPADEAKYVKPTVAVMSFENLAPILFGIRSQIFLR